MILTFGEIMMRLTPPGVLRLRQCLPGTLEATFGGGEANVAFSLALLGRSVRYLTALPDNPMADALLAELRGVGVDTSAVVRRPGRLGLYFLETGANQRGSNVVYDREQSAMSLAGPGAFNFDAALRDVTWVHTTGITPAISETAFAATLELCRLAKARGATVSCDLNFRRKLWRWAPGIEPRALARRCMAELLPFVDVVIANEEDASDVLGIEAEGSSVEHGRIDPTGYKAVARAIAARFPNVLYVAITLRESLSATHNNWGGMLFEAAEDIAHFAPLDAAGRYAPYEIRDIVDRVGGGDAFGAGLIHALSSADGREPAAAIRFAVAASCLKHSIQGDFNWTSEKEVTALMNGQTSGRVQR